MSKRYRVIYSPEAVSDLKTIYAYIAFSLSNPTAAKSTSEAIRSAIRSLDTMPNRHELVDWEPMKTMGLHHFAIKNYVVYYLVDESECFVSIVRIFYGGRDVTKLF